MTTFNGITVINRKNRPSPIEPAKLDFFMVKAGGYSDPYAVCSVHIFQDTQYGSPDAYLDLSAGSDNYGLVTSSNTSEKMVFRVQEVDGFKNRIGFTGNPADFPTEIDYLDASSASGIFKTGNGKFSVLLETDTYYYKSSEVADPDFNPINTLPTTENSASSVQGYLDIWTVVDAEGSKPQIYVNIFRLDTANVYATSEPLAVTTVNKLVQRYIAVGSKEKLRIKTELVVDNEPIEQSLRNLIETGALIQNPEISITKINEIPGQTSRVEITGLGAQGGFDHRGVEVDSHGTISYLWDTANIVPFYIGENLGGPTGVYEIQVKFNVLDQTILSNRFKLVVR